MHSQEKTEMSVWSLVSISENEWVFYAVPLPRQGIFFLCRKLISSLSEVAFPAKESLFLSVQFFPVKRAFIFLTKDYLDREIGTSIYM